MTMESQVLISPMVPEDIPQAQTLISAAMNAEEGDWAGVTMRRHFELQKIQVADGRHYFVHRAGGLINGIVGLHHYEWGPKENVWLGWFAVSPGVQGRGIGKGMLAAIQEEASRLGYRKLFIETYSSPTFARAREFYLRQGFAVAGHIASYLGDGSDMVVFLKELPPR